MIKLASFAAATLAIALVSGFVQFAPAIAQSTTLLADNPIVTQVTASQKTRCIMPAAQQKYCGV
jgi:hypothetical protein